MKLVMLGGTGSGKGTQAERLSLRYKVPVISTGNILREGISSGTELGKEAKKYVEKGELVPDQLMIQFIKQKLVNVSNGWILEGYPRTAFQAEELDFLLDELNQRLDYGIYLKVSESVMVERSLARSLVDDRPDVIERRIEMFHKSTVPLLEYYDYRHKLIVIDGEQSPEAVEQEIVQKLDSSLNTVR